MGVVGAVGAVGIVGVVKAVGAVGEWRWHATGAMSRDYILGTVIAEGCTHKCDGDNAGETFLFSNIKKKRMQVTDKWDVP